MLVRSNRWGMGDIIASYSPEEIIDLVILLEIGVDMIVLSLKTLSSSDDEFATGEYN